MFTTATATAPADDRDPKPTEARVHEYRAGTDRLRILSDFLARPIAACQDTDGRADDDVVSADNLARVAALRAVRRAADGA